MPPPCLRIGSMAVAKPPALLFAFHPVSSFTRETGSRFETTINREFPLINFMVSYPSAIKQRSPAGTAVATLLLWLYLTGAAIFIAGEANSAIEKAAAEAGHPDVRGAGEQRSGGEGTSNQ